MLRSTAARAVRPAYVALDRRLEQLAARLELHTMNLADVQRREIAGLDDRLALDVAVLSEHLVGVERMARHVGDTLDVLPASGERLLVALPGEALELPEGGRVLLALAPAGDATWRSVAGRCDPTDTATLRVAALPSSAG